MQDEVDVHDQLAEVIVEFCRFARASGISAGVKESVAALEAARAVGVRDKHSLKAALRAVLCSSKEEWDLFDDLFWLFWRASDRDAGQRARRAQKERALETQSARALLALMGSNRSTTGDEDGGRAVAGASANERLRKTDFSEVPQSDLQDLERLALQLLRRMSQRLSRRLKIMQLRGQVDLRRTIRRSIGRGGEPVDLAFKAKKLQQDRLVVLLDISGSMNAYSLFLMRFAFALQKYFRRVDTFVFSTQLSEITGTLRGRQLREALKELGEQAAGWSGGTKIGECLREFNEKYGRKLLTRDTLFMILSDGWDTGEPEVLASELATIRRRVRKLVWLNPLLGMQEYEPITRGMSAALPHVDVFAPAHNLESLLQLEGHLARH
jgi:uncharacterized protein with von Willebrand factor type A (vWA) domain